MVSMSAVWDRTNEFLSDNLGSVVPVALALVFLPNSIQGSIAPLATTPGSSLALGIGLASLLISLVSMWGQLSLVALALNPALTARQAPVVALRRMPAMIGTSLVVLAGLAVLWSPPVVLLALSGADLRQSGYAMPEIPAAARAWIAVSVLILVPLTIWLLARAVVLIAAVVVAERRAVGAIGRSWALSRGAAWRIIGVILLYGIVSWVATLAAKTVFGSVLRLVSEDEGAMSLAAVLTNVIVGAVATGFSVLAAGFTAKLYLALRDRTERA